MCTYGRSMERAYEFTGMGILHLYIRTYGCSTFNYRMYCSLMKDTFNDSVHTAPHTGIIIH